MFAAGKDRLVRVVIANFRPEQQAGDETKDDSNLLIGVRPRDVPVVITPTARLRHPTPGEFASHLGLTYRNVKPVAAIPGVTLWHSEDHTLPVIALSASFPAGSVYDQPGKSGMAALAAL